MMGAKTDKAKTLGIKVLALSITKNGIYRLFAKKLLLHSETISNGSTLFVDVASIKFPAHRIAAR